MSVFSSDGQNVFVNGTSVTTNISILDQIQLSKRFIADILKDANVAPTIPDAKGLLRRIFGDFGDIGTITYHALLVQLENSVFQNPIVISNVTVLKNVLKTSTVGSNTQISSAEKVFRESGMGYDKVCLNPEKVKTISTIASDLDSLAKGDSDYRYPNPNKTITFNNTFTKRLGFPNEVTWSCIGDQQVVMNLGNQIVLKGTKLTLKNYRLGNKENHDLISNNLNNLSECKKLLMTKEFGDVAQVWMYLAYVAEKYEKERTKVVMITTDSVVYMFCSLLALSCIYTGSREGVTSGGCTLKHYLSGPVDYKLKLNNMIEVYSKRLLSNNSAIRIGLQIMALDFNKFQYLRTDGSKLRKTYGSFTLERDPQIRNQKWAQIREVFAEYITRIQNNENSIVEYVNNLKSNIESTNVNNDGIVNNIYNTLIYETNQYKIDQIITKLNSKEYTVNPGQLLSTIGAILEIPVPTSIDDLINGSRINGGAVEKNKVKNNALFVAKTSKTNKLIQKQPYRKTVETTMDDETDEGIGYYESLFMYYSSTKMNNLDSEENQIVFATLYDYYSYNLENGLFDKDLQNIVNTVDEDTILEFGKNYSNFIYFANDYEEEMEDLELELKFANQMLMSQLDQPSYLSMSDPYQQQIPVSGGKKKNKLVRSKVNRKKSKSRKTKHTLKTKRK